MRTVSIFKNGNNRAIRLPRDLDFEGVSELEIVREGDSIILRPVRPTWGSFLEYEKGHCCKVSDEAAFCLIQRPYISKTLLTRRISPRGSP